ncbi:MAG TPA: hypothetical protein VEP50_20665 [bacterium]|nr:hypothetical protein [bacterium]
MGLEHPSADLTSAVLAIKAIAHRQQRGIVRLERDTVETTTEQLAELIAALQNPTAPGTEARRIILETLSVVDTNLELLRVIEAARERLLAHFGGPAMAMGLLVNRSV